MGLLAFLVSALYWPGIAGAATTPRWALLFAVIPWLVIRPRWTAPHAVGAALLIWAAFSLQWSPELVDGIGAIFTLSLLALLFCVGWQLDDLRPVYWGAGLGIALSGPVAALQLNGYEVVRGLGAAGLFVNPNFMGEAAALALVVFVASRHWAMVAAVAPPFVMSGSRGAVLALCAALCVHFWRQWRPFGAVIALSLALLAFDSHYKGATVSQESLSLQSLSGGTMPVSDPALSDREAIWRSTVNGLTVLGRGIGSFWGEYPRFEVRPDPPSRPEFPHNEWLHIAFELGLPGLLLFCVLCLTLAGPIDTSRLVLIALAVESCFGFPLHVPTTAFIGALAAGHAVRSRYVLRDFALYGRGGQQARMAREGVWPVGWLACQGGPDHALRTSIPERRDHPICRDNEVRMPW